MAVLFTFSSIPAVEMPRFGLWDFIVKKGSHMLIYGLLAAAYRHALPKGGRWTWFAWLLAVTYAATDEFHQVFVPGRHPSLVDILVFDGIGAFIGLGISRLVERSRKYAK